MTKWMLRGVLALSGLLLVAALVAWLALRGSLPVLDGERSLAGLSAPATVARDANGVVTIDAGSEADAYRALGWVHAQERYFEMDLLRPCAAGGPSRRSVPARAPPGVRGTHRPRRWSSR